jgi:alpha-D-ribose 1-methylphosphonate 5-phosphate C-P lyase
MRDPHYNFGYLDERTKRMIRRAILKAVAIPGFQVPFGSREMPLPYGWGTGGVQVTASIIGPDDVLKVIDQGADDTVNAVNIRRFFQRTTGVATTERTVETTLIQTPRGRSWSTRCRCPSPCSGSRRARRRRAGCTRSRSTG